MPPPAAIDINTHEFLVPEKQLSAPSHMDRWLKSEAYNDILGFIQAMNDAAKDKTQTDIVQMSQLSENLMNMLETMDRWITEIPPIKQAQRFGNKAFKDYYTRLQNNAADILKTALGETYDRAVPEVCTYLVESVGNSTRIDYGTGHELAFIAFLCCLYKIGALKETDASAVVLRVFTKYMDVARRLQKEYNMEPAGSHGVWSLDDYQFIPFIWGSAQLFNNSLIKPESLVNKDVAVHNALDYMFMAAIKHIFDVKTGPFFEHSNTLWNISSVQSWAKVNGGLIKMYKVEILSKFPVIQHFLFGSLLSLNPVT